MGCTRRVEHLDKIPTFSYSIISLHVFVLLKDQGVNIQQKSVLNYSLWILLVQIVQTNRTMELSKEIIDVLCSENAPQYQPRQESQPAVSALAGKTAPSTAATSQVSFLTTCGSSPSVYLSYFQRAKQVFSRPPEMLNSTAEQVLFSTCTIYQLLSGIILLYKKFSISQ